MTLLADFENPQRGPLDLECHISVQTEKLYFTVFVSRKHILASLCFPTCWTRLKQIFRETRLIAFHFVTLMTLFSIFSGFVYLFHVFIISCLYEILVCDPLFRSARPFPFIVRLNPVANRLCRQYAFLSLLFKFEVFDTYFYIVSPRIPKFQCLNREFVHIPPFMLLIFESFFQHVGQD